MLRKIRIALAAFFFVAVTFLFLDFTGLAHKYLSWTASLQFLPAVLALNVVVVTLLVAVTLLIGRVYCSVICPLGIMQDIIAWFGRRGKKKRYKYSYSGEKRWLRYGFLAFFLVSLVAGLTSLAALIAPYSSYGRIAGNLMAPIYRWGNNILAYFAGRMDSYAFYGVDVWMKSLPVFIIAVVSFAVIAILAWRGGRTYCNTVCPVGTVLGLLSKYSLFTIRIDAEKCNRCGLCSRRCKSSCINGDSHTVDDSRCVVCMDCIETCRHGAISFGLRRKKKTVENKENTAGSSRRAFLATTSALAVSSVVNAQKKKVDGGLAVIADKQIPKRNTKIVPAGAWSIRHFEQHCTSCQLCVSACPNGVLRPSSDLSHFMQPEMSYERGYCRPECTRCSDVCPTSAINPITREEKSSTRIGHAVWVRKNCLPVSEGVSCGNCARHCPTGAILMVPMDAEDEKSLKIPVVNTERCIGCGACENLCPSRPFSAIYVEGHERHSQY